MTFQPTYFAQNRSNSDDRIIKEKALHANKINMASIQRQTLNRSTIFTEKILLFISGEQRDICRPCYRKSIKT